MIEFIKRLLCKPKPHRNFIVEMDSEGDFIFKEKR